MNSGCSTWCRSQPAWMYRKTGLSAQVPRGGRGGGASASHSSRPWCAGSAVSSRCSAVVPVLGSPVTNNGLPTETCACSGGARQPASLSSRVPRLRPPPRPAEQPARQRAAQHGPRHLLAARGKVRVTLVRGDQLGQPVVVVVRPEVLKPGDLRRRGVQLLGGDPGP